MGYSIAPLERLTEQLERLPGVGRKSAARLAFHLLYMPQAEAKALQDAVADAREKICECPVCCNLTDTSPCAICGDSAGMPQSSVWWRMRGMCWRLSARASIGLYQCARHHLPDGWRGPEQRGSSSCCTAWRMSGMTEVIMATNPTVEGDYTAVYLSRLLKPLHIKVTRLAYGIPVGADLEYADEVTLSRSLEGRSEL